LKQFSEELGAELVRYRNRSTSLCGVPFNIDSPKQLGDVLFETLKLGKR
jgi:DNA polymerase-1